jgi:hypothetical protein
MSSEEQTLYEVLDLHPRATAEEVREAHARAQEMYGPDSMAVYALVDESQIEALRARLAEAAEVLLDPARRAGYDRSLGLVPTATLWAEDDEDEELGSAGAPGPGAPSPEPVLTPVPAPPPEVVSAPVAREDIPRQRTLPLEISEKPIRIMAAAPEAPPAEGGSTLDAPEPIVQREPAPLLANDWAAAVPTTPSAPASDGAVAPPPERRSPGRGLPPPLPRSSSFGLRARLQRGGGGSRPSVPSMSAATSGPPTQNGPPELPAAAQASHLNETDPELAARPRDSRPRLDIPPDAEFNGELLRQVREAYGLSLQQVAERTRITRIHLENVEADRYDHLPATVYLRGILVNLARELRLDPARVSKSYLLAASRGMPRGL